MKKQRFSIQILSNPGSWRLTYTRQLAALWRKQGHRVRLCDRVSQIRRADFTFVLGFLEIIPPKVLRKSQHNLVFHESPLPRGRGWSPLSWRILEGAQDIRLSLFEAVPQVDAGPIYITARVPLKGTELLPDLRQKAGMAMQRLCQQFLDRYPSILKYAKPQQGHATYYKPRKPQDCRLDIRRPLVQYFNLLRICDSKSYPAYFQFRGETYLLRLEKKPRTMS